MPSINVAVDTGNAVSLHSGIPVSVLDLRRLKAPLRVQIAPAGAEYEFNASGQTIDLEGLLCLCDTEGPCGSAVKDSQRTKTHPGTRETLSLLWGTTVLGDRTVKAAAWYRELLGQVEAATEIVLR